MTTVTIEIEPKVEDVASIEDKLYVSLADGRLIAIPLSWYPRLTHATAQERANWQILSDSSGRDIIFWESLDELIPVIALIEGIPSRESAKSFNRWLKQRTVSSE